MENKDTIELGKRLEALAENITRWACRNWPSLCNKQDEVLSEAYVAAVKSEKKYPNSIGPELPWSWSQGWYAYGQLIMSLKLQKYLPAHKSGLNEEDWKAYKEQKRVAGKPPKREKDDKRVRNVVFDSCLFSLFEAREHHISCVEPEVEGAERLCDIKDHAEWLMQNLTGFEKHVLTLYYYDEKSKDQIADYVGCTGEWVRLVLKAVTKKLRQREKIMK